MTSYDVARAAGVSQSAVSRCFAPGGSVAPATRQRIIKIARDMDYRPNAFAQGLVLGRTNLVAVVLSRQADLQNPELLGELKRRLVERNMGLLLYSPDEDNPLDAVLDQLWRHGVDGIVAMAEFSDGQIQLCAHYGVPLVLYNRPFPSAAASVDCDTAAGVRLLISRLLAAGHQRFAIIAGPLDCAVSTERWMTARDRLATAGIIDVPVIHSSFEYESGREAFHAIIATGYRPDAVVCGNDLIAIGAIDAARHELGIDIPHTMSVVGFDGCGPANWLGYQVTSIRQPVRHMATAAVSMLMERIENRSIPIERRLFSGELLAGNSARLA